MAFYMLLIAHGLSVNFHLCAEDHHMIGSFGDASELCVHCVGHHHHHHMDDNAYEEHLEITHFEPKCCCKNFDSEIGFTDNFTFSPEKSLDVFLPYTHLANRVYDLMDLNLVTVFRCFTQLKIPYLLTGRLATIFFSSLKLNPLVF